MYFDLIDIFMNSKTCFNPLHSRDFVNFDDVYCAIFFHDFSPSENLGSNEELNCEDALEKYASPFAARDLILHYAKTLEEGNNWAIPSNLHIVGHNTPRNFCFSPNRTQDHYDSWRLTKPYSSTQISKSNCNDSKCKKGTTYIKSNSKMNYTTIALSKKSWAYSFTTMHNKKYTISYK